MKLKDLLTEEIDSPSEVAAYLSKLTSGGIIVDPKTGNFICRRNLVLTNGGQSLLEALIETSGESSTLKYQFDGILGNFSIEKLNLTDFKNFPRQVNGDLEAWGNKFTNLEGITPKIGKILTLSFNDGLTSFANIGKYIKSCSQIFVPRVLKERILGLIMIKGLEVVYIDDAEVSEDEVPELTTALKIIGTRLLDNELDILDCKEELMTFDKYNLKDFAKL